MQSAPRSVQQQRREQQQTGSPTMLSWRAGWGVVARPSGPAAVGIAGSPPCSPRPLLVRTVSPSQPGCRADAVASSCGSPREPCECSDVRQTFWALAASLLRPCSLFDAGDTDAINSAAQLLRQSQPQQARELQRAFLESPQVMTFALARLTAWGLLMLLYSRQGQGAAAAQLHGTPGRLLRQLALTGGSRVCFK